MCYLDYFCEILKRKLLVLRPSLKDKIKGFGVPRDNNNFFDDMIPKTIKEYECGEGDELNGDFKRIRSSAAMIYNLLGNGDVVISKNDYLLAGEYEKEFEYKLPTLKDSRRKANLDAWLHNDECEIFIEAKCLEWFENKHKKDLTDSYFYWQKYFYPETAKYFIEAGKQIYLSQYDSCQMFKHTLAIYNYLKKKQIKNNKIYLVNVVWEPDENDLPDEIRAIYKLQLELEHREFHLFYEKMKPIINLIKTELAIDFDILYLSVKDFHSMLNFSDENQKKFVQRYL